MFTRGTASQCYTGKNQVLSSLDQIAMGTYYPTNVEGQASEPISSKLKGALQELINIDSISAGLKNQAREQPR
jgi:hypothetical protein